MSLPQILLFTLLALSLGALADARLRLWGLLILSVAALFWLQPLTPLRHYTFWLPTLTLMVSVASWVVTQGDRSPLSREDWLTFGVLLAIILLLGSTRFLPGETFVTAERPPGLASILRNLAASLTMLLFLYVGVQRSSFFVVLMGALVVICFLALKIEPITVWTSEILRGWNGQDPDLASVRDLRWMGFSYIALRLLHTILDRLAGRLPAVSLREYIVYVIFYPALAAGPIARIEGFIEQLRKQKTIQPSEACQGSQRIFLGLIKKFVLADSLGLIALDAANVFQVQNPSWMWVLLYAYALQLYLDFSAYTDIAVGIGRLAGVGLPENFRRPYLQPNIRMFWNNWHITLALWFRTYFFNPVTRRARRLTVHLPESVLILSMHLSTMALIGLWHGVKWNFLLWGIWHGLGLFAHNRWSAFIHRFPRIRESRLITGPASYALGVFLTFHFVVLGWVLFAFSDLDTIGHTYRALFRWSSSPMTGG